MLLNIADELVVNAYIEGNTQLKGPELYEPQ